MLDMFFQFLKDLFTFAGYLNTNSSFPEPLSTEEEKNYLRLLNQGSSEAREKLIENKVRIFVRRGGPNYKEGLAKMRALGESLGVPIEVFGPETHMTKIVSMALKA